jgi:hypothetical protein
MALVTEAVPSSAPRRVGGPEWAQPAALAASFATAAASVEVSAHRLLMAGKPVSLRCAGLALQEQVLPALAHLAAGEDCRAEPALTVHLWDSASTRVEPPRRPAVREDHAYGALYHLHDPPVRAVYQPGLETLSAVDFDAGLAWHWVAAASEQPYWEQACPIRQLLFWWLSAQGYLQVHGAAVGLPGGGVLLVGKAGSGKSTTALACLGSELLYAGDDYVAVAVEPEPRVQSLYSSGKLEPAHVRTLLPRLVPLLANADRLQEEKAVIYAHEHFPEQTTPGFPLRAIVVPRVQRGQRESRIVRSSRREAFAALAPSTMVQLHTADSAAWSTMARLTALVPCFGLELGSDVGAIPGVLSAFLRELSSAVDA